jgi:hypothetical protein
MKTIQIKNCQDSIQTVNIDFIYKLTEENIRGVNVTTIYLNHKDDNYTFEIIKTYESKRFILARLELYK